MYNIYITLLSILVVSSLSTDTDNITTYNANAMQSLFRVVTPDEGFFTTYYDGPTTTSSVLLYAEESVDNFTVSLKSMKTDIATVSEDVTVGPCQMETNWTVQYNSSLEANLSYKAAQIQDDYKCYNLTFHSTAVYIGYSIVKVYVKYNDTSPDIHTGDFLLRSIRYHRPIDTVFNVTVIIMVILTTLVMGNDLNLQTVKEHLKRPKAPIIALTSQFVLMPLIAYTIIYISGYTGGTALGFFALGCSPGGGSSNMYSKLFNGDMSLSVTMTTLSTLASLVMLPLWIYTLGTTLPADEGLQNIQLPFTNILTSLAALIIPLVVGILIKHKLPRVSRVVRKSMKVLFVVVILFFLTFGVYSNLYIFVGWDARLILSACMLPYTGYILGALLAWICRFDWTLIKTISIETGLQNVGVCILVVKAVGSQPESDLAIILPVVANMATSWPLLIALPIYLIRERILKKKKEKLEADRGTSESSGSEEVNFSVDVNADEKSTREEVNEADVEMKLLNK